MSGSLWKKDISLRRKSQAEDHFEPQPEPTVAAEGALAPAEP
jgi:hypothetical protein